MLCKKNLGSNLHETGTFKGIMRFHTALLYLNKLFEIQNEVYKFDIVVSLQICECEYYL